MLSKEACIVIGLIILGAAVWYYYSQKKTEGYLAAGAMDHLDSLDGRYELIESRLL